MDSKQIFSENLRRHMELSRKTRKDISESLGISYYTVSDWVNGVSAGRVCKAQQLNASLTHHPTTGTVPGGFYLQKNIS